MSSSSFGWLRHWENVAFVLWGIWNILWPIKLYPTFCLNKPEGTCDGWVFSHGHSLKKKNKFLKFFWTGFNVEMSVRLDKEFTPDLNDATSSAYKELETSVNSVVSAFLTAQTLLIRTYIFSSLCSYVAIITNFIHSCRNSTGESQGFLKYMWHYSGKLILHLTTFGGRNLCMFYTSTWTFVCSYRQGSIIADFVVQTKNLNSKEFAVANQNLPQAISPIAPVIGTVTATYNSKFK